VEREGVVRPATEGDDEEVVADVGDPGNFGAGSRRTCSSSTTSACTSSPHGSRAISTMWSPSAIDGPP
jgi:hypothetical protein